MAELAKYSGINDTLASAPVYQSTPGNIPQEIWGHILRYVDDEFTLWVTCRQVSHVFRAEAEREFALTRLPKLSFSSSAWCEVSNTEHTHCYGCKIITEKLQSFLKDGQEVKYKIKISSCLCDIDNNGRPIAGNYSENHSILRKTVISLLGYRFPSDEVPQFEYHTHRVELGYHFNDTPLKYTSLDFDNLTLAFQWKLFMNDFFKSTSYIQKRAQITTPISCFAEQSLDQLFERIAANPESKRKMLDDWGSDYGEEENEYSYEAYVDRVHHTHPDSVVKIMFLLHPARVRIRKLRKIIEASFRKLRRFLTRRPDPNIPDPTFTDAMFKNLFIYSGMSCPRGMKH
ncbi:hypothetical protein COCSADRAFT_156224 [Bipolaris sorokiniana ND90Pr]|uniref:F-box domain-containing protein n=1 Tax=Cochliobolus sativus (strain ND90Pr / ATCC 201652) TaxID=665912 RepID=M2RU48_COCSN|nr:uncharacterized protein COCSADRAFT_156224 [Bipolaris sorokiniana ND90Pr]EMD70099.1 hypothetical protein COCSADRAFT_156224 [Bipolaris sorokiniana ND90Pr]